MVAKLLTLNQVSELTHVPVATLRWFRAQNIGPKTFRLGGRVMAREEDVDAWVQAQYLASTTEDTSHGDAGAGPGGRPQ